MPAGLQLRVHQRLVFRRLDLIEHRRQLLVLRYDQRNRLLGDVRIGSQHDRHRLADIIYFVDGEDRLIVEGRSVIGIGDDLAHVLGGDDAVDPGHFPRRH